MLIFSAKLINTLKKINWEYLQMQFSLDTLIVSVCLSGSISVIQNRDIEMPSESKVDYSGLLTRV